MKNNFNPMVKKVKPEVIQCKVIQKGKKIGSNKEKEEKILEVIE